MLHIKFQGHQSTGSGDEDFLRLLPYMGMAAKVGLVTYLFHINFHSHSPSSFHMSFGYKSPNYVCEKQALTLKSE